MRFVLKTISLLRKWSKKPIKDCRRYYPTIMRMIWPVWFPSCVFMLKISTMSSASFRLERDLPISYYCKNRVRKPAIVIELKFKNDVIAAIDQIHQNNYPGKLKDYYGELILVGIAYDKKKAHDCVIERFEREKV